MNAFEESLLRYLGEKRLARIQSVTIGIAGAGGLGSNCACNLVRSGFKRFVIGDFDSVEPGNLDRQFFFLDQVGRKKVEALRENLLRINPHLEIRVYAGRIEEENLDQLFAECDIIVEAFDQVQYKRMIVEHYLSTGKFLVSASGLAGWGKSDDLRIRRVRDNFFLVGDFVTEVGEDIPPLSPRVNIVAAKQADIILEYVLGKMRGVKR